MQPHFYNTLTRSVDEFKSITSGKVKMYSCGPTVYDYQHIGNLSNPVFVDVLKRTLAHAGYTVEHAINFTDFGHLTSDADSGDDKMMKGLKREGLAITMENMAALGKTYANAYMEDLQELHIDTSTITFPYASEYVPQQIAMIEALLQKGYAYETTDGVYFEISHFPTYGELGGINLEELSKEHMRVQENTEKHHPADFALWKKNSELGWNSPWGKGFPGWHIECSAMIRAVLGAQIDIHTGGIEHIAVHHNNEIAQSEASSGKKPFARFWMHRAHIRIDDTKISKSIGNTIYLRHIIDKGYSPLVYRYWLLTAHYRTPSNFTWEALDAAATAYKKLRRTAYELQTHAGGRADARYIKKFTEYIYNDLDTPKALALAWELLKDDRVSPASKHTTLIEFDTVLGLSLFAPTDERKIVVEDIPRAVQELFEARKNARAAKDYAQSDALRDQLKDLGYDVTDNGDSSTLSPL